MRLGSDPELFLHKGGSFVSAVGIIPGTKDNPVPIPGLPDGFTVQHDNVALELGIPPAQNAEEFSQFIKTAIYGAKANFHSGLSHSLASCVEFPAHELRTAEARHFGCEPDYDAWLGGKENPKPTPPTPNLRSCGGHVHIETKLDKLRVVRGCDYYLGLPSVVLDTSGQARRQIYGKPGAYRPKPYGVEYRTLSNFWIFTHSYRVWVWKACERVLDRVMKGDTFDDPAVRDAIDKGDVEAATNLMVKYGISVTV